MLLTLSTTHQPATDLGYLLHKHPDRLQEAELMAGKALIFYPEASEEKCTAALLLQIDPIALVRNRKGPSGEGFALEQYVNDRPYVASSFMSAAIAQAWASAMNGNCTKRPELPTQLWPWEVKLSVLSVRGGRDLVQRLFGPLGYTIELQSYPLDNKFPEWGQSRYYTMTLKGNATLSMLLSQLYILLPVLDNDKHYFISRDEVNKLLDKGKGWLDQHPEREFITHRYLLHIKAYTRHALDVLMKEEEPEAEEQPKELEEPKEKIRLHDLRLDTVTQKLVDLGVKEVVDLGCGEGKLIRRLIKEKAIQKITGMDISMRSLEIARDRLHFDRHPSERVKLIHGSLTYCDSRWKGVEAAVLVEVIEHLDPFRLKSLEKVLFDYAAPHYVILTTPNADYNVNYPSLTAGTFRHSDHRFEWTREEFKQWGDRVAQAYNYSVEYEALGEVSEAHGGPSQLALFKRKRIS